MFACTGIASPLTASHTLLIIYTQLEEERAEYEQAITAGPAIPAGESERGGICFCFTFVPHALTYAICDDIILLHVHSPTFFRRRR